MFNCYCILQVLDLHNNEIKSLPNEITELRSLQVSLFCGFIHISLYEFSVFLVLSIQSMNSPLVLLPLQVVLDARQIEILKSVMKSFLCSHTLYPTGRVVTLRVFMLCCISLPAWVTMTIHQ